MSLALAPRFATGGLIAPANNSFFLLLVSLLGLFVVAAMGVRYHPASRRKDAHQTFMHVTVYGSFALLQSMRAWRGTLSVRMSYEY